LFCDKFKVSGAALLGRLFAALNFDSIEDLIGIRNLKNIESCDCGYTDAILKNPKFFGIANAIALIR
jgi:hypothetical protein